MRQITKWDGGFDAMRQITKWDGGFDGNSVECESVVFRTALPSSARTDCLPARYGYYVVRRVSLPLLRNLQSCKSFPRAMAGRAEP